MTIERAAATATVRDDGGRADLILLDDEGATIGVLVAQAHALFRGALASGLADEADLAVVAAVGTSEEAVAQIAALRPDVALVDADLQPRTGIEVCAEVKSRGVPTRVLVLSERCDQAVLVAAVEAGADGYVDLSSDLRGVVRAIRRLHAGEPCIPGEMLGGLLRHLIQRRRDEDGVVDRFSRLSRREREVLALLTEGKDNRAIAEALVVSPHTARTHIQKVLEKLEVHSRLEAAALASQHRLIERFGGLR